MESKFGSESVKIVVVGPAAAGKSCIANLLSNQTETISAPSTHVPTVGVRILECERNVPGRGRQPCEIWDVSGNSSYESCWGAIMQDMHGAVLVYNPDKDGNDIEIGDWFDYFVKNNDLRNNQVLVFAHHSEQRNLARAPPKLSEVKVVDTSFDSAVTTILHQNFDDFLVHCVDAKNRGHDEK